MDTVTIIKINKQEYYHGDELFGVNPILFKGCRNSRAIVDKKEINKDDYIFAKNINDKWKKVDGTSKRFDKLFLLKTWVNSQDIEQIDVAPEIIILNDNENFKDDDGNILEIETRGERDVGKCYFRLRDVAKGFVMKNLHRIIISDDTQYEKKVHYKYFICNNYKKLEKTTNAPNTNKKILYLTYEGILRVLFVSRSGNTSSFINWATKTLFTVQMGTKMEKKKLASSVLGVSVKELKAVFSKTTFALPTIYLITLGLVKDLRKQFSIGKEYKDDDILAKYGMTIDIKRRAGEHERDYGKMKNVNLELVQYQHIDPQYVSSAETDLGDILKGLGLYFKHDEHKELIIFNKNNMKVIVKQYEQIGKAYIGHISELVTKIKDLERDIEMTKVKHENDILKEKNEVTKEKHENEVMKGKHENEVMKVKHENELLKKDIEIMKLQKKK